jgi:LysR family transcriptional regulator for metE and metH
LELVLALGAARSTSGAAARLHLSQPAVSRALLQTEERLGVELFKRSARGLTPTQAGERLMLGAPAVIQQLYELEQQASVALPPPVQLRLVCECYTAYRWLPSAVIDLRERMPDLDVEVATQHAGNPVEALLKNKIDIALLTTAEVPRQRGLSELPLFSDEVVFAVGARHPLSRATHVTRAALEAEPLITGNTPAAEARWFVSAVFGRRRPQLSYLKFPLTEAIVDAARAGMGIAVLSEWVVSQYLEQGDLRLLRLPKGPLRRPWRIAFRTDSRMVAERLQDALVGAAPRLRRGA